MSADRAPPPEQGEARLRRLLVEEQRSRIETEQANTRLHLLVEGSRRLSRSLNVTETLETLASVVVPGLADWSYIVQRDSDGGPPSVACGVGDRDRRAILDRYACFAPDPTAPEGPSRVFRTGQLALYEDIGEEQLGASASGWPIVGTRDPEALRLVHELGMRALLCVPVLDRGAVYAVMMLVSADDPYRYAGDDLVLARDLAARAAISLENGRLIFEALDSVRARDEFLSVAAHELRTPLTSLLLQIQMLRRAYDQGRLDLEASGKGIAMAEQQVRRLSSLVDGLLDVARMATHRLWIRFESVDLRQLIDSVLTKLAADLRRAGCVVEVHAPRSVRCRLDRVRIEQVLVNILSNAMKFGAGRPIELEVEASDADLRISVRDHGIGISESDQARIFGRFERAVSAREFAGLGLGLYLSVQIVHAHKGSLRVESQPGQGSCFIVELPRGLQHASPRVPAPAPG